MLYILDLEKPPIAYYIVFRLNFVLDLVLKRLRSYQRNMLQVIFPAELRSAALGTLSTES